MESFPMHDGETFEACFKRMLVLISAAKVQPQTAQQVTLGETGMYLVTVITADGQRTSQRAVVNK